MVLRQYRSGNIKAHRLVRYFLLVPGLLLLMCISFFVPDAKAIDLGSYPVDELSTDSFSIHFYREERPSFFWVATGIPDVFLAGVSVISGTPNHLVYSIRSIEYGVRINSWVSDDLQLRFTLPFEANALEDLNSNTHSIERFGDLELGATYLFVGNQKEGGFMGMEGWFRAPTGTDPFNLSFPALSTGQGTTSEDVGVIARQEADSFSFFQSINYQTSQSFKLGFNSRVLGPGSFRWPDSVDFIARVEWEAQRRLQRAFTLFGQVQLKATDAINWNGQAISYDQGRDEDQVIIPELGMVARVDDDFSAEGDFTMSPLHLIGNDPDWGVLFSMDLVFRPI